MQRGNRIKSKQIIKNALLVEDDQIIQRVNSAQLADLGYEVETADDATMALNKLKEKVYCLILTDLCLPDKPGTEVIKAASEYELNQGTPIIVSSAQLSQANFKIYFDLGADAVLVKPYSLHVLEETIQHCHLTPYYQRKFYHQVKTCVKSLEENLEPAQTKEEFHLWIERFQLLLTQSLYILQEYQQCFLLEKVN